MKAKPKSYSVSVPHNGITKRAAVWLDYEFNLNGEPRNGTRPLIYLQRPKWIKDDACWERIVKSVRLDLLPAEIG